MMPDEPDAVSHLTPPYRTRRPTPRTTAEFAEALNRLVGEAEDAGLDPQDQAESEAMAEANFAIPSLAKCIMGMYNLPRRIAFSGKKV
jgi:hypothetical protein